MITSIIFLLRAVRIRNDKGNLNIILNQCIFISVIILYDFYLQKACVSGNIPGNYRYAKIFNSNEKNLTKSCGVSKNSNEIFRTTLTHFNLTFSGGIEVEHWAKMG